MQPGGAAAPLPPRAGEALFNAISGMTAETWADPAQLEDTLRRSEGLLCALHAGCAGLGAYVQLLSGGAGEEVPWSGGGQSRLQPAVEWCALQRSAFLFAASKQVTHSG